MSLRPLLEPTAKVKSDWISRPFLPGLSITYVVDRRGSFDRVTRATLEAWGVPEDQVAKEAVEWFTAFVDPLEFRVFQDGDKSDSRKVAHPDLKGIYTASLILTPSFKEGVRRIFGDWEGLLIAIPSRKQCWILRTSDEKTRKKLRKELIQEFRNSPHALLDHYLVTKGKEEYREGPSF